MTLTFDSKLAKRYGINIAVIYSVFIDYITSCTNEDFLFSTNGKTYTKIPMSYFSKVCEFMSETVIYKTIKKMERLGLIESIKPNVDKFDMSKWYKLTK